MKLASTKNINQNKPLDLPCCALCPCLFLALGMGLLTHVRLLRLGRWADGQIYKRPSSPGSFCKLESRYV